MPRPAIPASHALHLPSCPTATRSIGLAADGDSALTTVLDGTTLLGGSGAGGGGNDSDDEEGAGGGGSGGTIHLFASEVSITGTVSAQGGLGGTDDYSGGVNSNNNGGQGSVGRIRVDYGGGSARRVTSHHAAPRPRHVTPLALVAWPVPPSLG